MYALRLSKYYRPHALIPWSMCFLCHKQDVSTDLPIFSIFSVFTLARRKTVCLHSNVKHTFAHNTFHMFKIHTHTHVRDPESRHLLKRENREKKESNKRRIFEPPPHWSHLKKTREQKEKKKKPLLESIFLLPGNRLCTVSIMRHNNTQ